ncbi:MAG: ATP-binding cassette domain-containing protein [Byssovorax sp.]
MRTLLAILRRLGPSLRGGLAGSLTQLILLSALTGATAGVLPAVMGIALNAVLGRPSGPPAAGVAGFFAHLVAGFSPWAVILAALGATLVTVAISVYSSQRGSQLSGEVTAALRIEMLRAVLHASPRAVDEAGKATMEAKAGPNAPAPPPGVKAPPVRGMEIVKLAVARESGMVADFAVSLLAGLPQAIITLAVLSFELVAGGTGVVLAGGALLFVLSRLASDRASRRVGREMQAMQHADVAVFGSLGEMLAATEDLRLLGARRDAVVEFAHAAHRTADARRRFTGALAVSGQIKSVFSAISPLLILVALKLGGQVSDPGEVAKLLLVVPLLMARLEALDALRAGLIEREPLLRATQILLDLPASPAPPAQPVSASAVKAGEIDFKGLSYTPPGAGKPVIDGLDLRIPPGALVGICGRSGCGKSTLLRLLLRLDDPASGSITIDGTDLGRIEPAELPQVFAVLGQASRLLERSVEQNLALGLDPPPPHAAMHAALARVDLKELCEPGGARSLATEVKMVPPNFSGGEQRRLMLARMLLRSARIFVLDEPEAGLPSATAEQLLRGVKEIAEGRTCLVVTHAPHLLKSTFNVVIDAGKVVATGTHEELTERSEIYRSLLAEALREGPKKGPGGPPGMPPGMMGPPGAPPGMMPPPGPRP